MTALIATLEKAADWFLHREPEPECRQVDGWWEMLTPAEREAALNFEGDDTVGTR